MTSIRTSTKVAQVLRDIEAARCRGKWQVIPDLAKRYKKYCPSGTVLEQTILIEAALSRLTDRAEQEQSIVFENGTKDAVKLQQRITADTSKPFLHQLHAVLALPETDDDTPVQREFAKIILARCHFECGQYRDTLDIVEQLAFSKSDVSSGYNFILFLQARAMKALSYEQLGDITAAMQSYQGIVSLLEEAPEESLDQKVLVEWAEEALCRAIVLNTGAQAVDDVTITLGFIRSYQKVTGSVSSLWRPHKRLYTLRHSIKYLSDLYREGQYVTGTDASVARYQFAAELMQLNATYERLLFSTLPKSGEKNRMLFEFLEQMADDLSYIGDTDPRHLLGLKQVLYRAAEHTFNSPTISRLLFHTLIQMGDYEEAIYALRSYLYLVGLGSQTWDEARQKGEALIASNGKICVYPHIAGGALERLVDDSTSSKNSIASHRTNEYESTEDILNVLLAAVKMYCLHMRQGPEAVEYAEMARLKMEKAEPDSSLRPKVYLTASSAYIYLAYQTRDSHLRSTYFQKALDYLNESSTADSSTWETYYLLALLHATTRDIQSVIPLISKALQLHPAHIPSWHLLTLACSCPTQDDYEHAIQACDIGLRQAQEVDVDPADQLRLHITRTLLLEKMQGPQTALEAQEELFAMYSKVITPDISLLDSSVYNDEMVLSGPFNNLDENSIVGMPRRVSEASIHLKVDESQISASKSHDEIRGKPKNMRGTTTRARSASSFSGKHLNSNGHSTFLTVPSEDGLSTKTSSTQNSKQHHHHHLPFHLHSSRGSSKRSNGELLPKSMHKMGSNKVSQAPSIHGSTQTDLDDNISVLSSSMNSFYSVQQPGISSAKRPLSIRLKQQESKRLLVDLWLLSACSFLKLGKHDEALKAVQEAENIDASSNPRIYCVLGRIFLAQNQLEDATDAFEKAVHIDASDVESRIWLARALIQNDSMDSAEGLLEQATKEFAWDNAEAWLLLAEIYRKSDRLDRAKDCMMYALDLANTTPIQPFSILPCFV